MTKIHESEYGSGENNFHVEKYGDTLNVTLTYPPWTDADNKNNQCRYIRVDQEAVRASDGVRLHYDYERDGFVVEQPRPTIRAEGKDTYVSGETWIEVGFFPSWRFDTRPNNEWTEEELARVEAGETVEAPLPENQFPTTQTDAG